VDHDKREDLSAVENALAGGSASLQSRLTGNAVVAFALAAGLVAMVMANSNTGPRDAIVAGSKIASDVVAAADK
jgi:hypothetical protein